MNSCIEMYNIDVTALKEEIQSWKWSLIQREDTVNNVQTQVFTQNMITVAYNGKGDPFRFFLHLQFGAPSRDGKLF